MLLLTPEEREFLTALREDGILQRIDGEKLSPTNGIISICCSDGDQFDDLYCHQVSLCERHSGLRRPHMLTLHGGMLRVPPWSPLNREASGSAALIHDAGKAAVGKSILRLSGYAHFPCLAVREVGLDPAQAVQLMFDAEQLLERAINGLTVIRHAHVDWQDSQLGKKSYHLPKRQYLEWLRTSGVRFATL